MENEYYVPIRSYIKSDEKAASLVLVIGDPIASCGSIETSLTEQVVIGSGATVVNIEVECVGFRWNLFSPVSDECLAQIEMLKIEWICYERSCKMMGK